MSQALPDFGRATVERTPTAPGRLGFACGMNMVHGTLVVEPNRGDGTTEVEPAAAFDGDKAAGPTSADQSQPAQPKDSDAEIADLARRVSVG